MVKLHLFMGNNEWLIINFYCILCLHEKHAGYKSTFSDKDIYIIGMHLIFIIFTLFPGQWQRRLPLHCRYLLRPGVHSSGLKCWQG